MNAYLFAVLLAAVLPTSLGHIFKIQFPRPGHLAEVLVVSSQSDVKNSLSIFVREPRSYMKHLDTVVAEEQDCSPLSASHRYTLDAHSSNSEFMIEIFAWSHKLDMIKAKSSHGDSGIIFLQTASEVWIKINPNKGMLPESFEDALIEGVSYTKGSHEVEIVGAIDLNQRKHLKGPLFVLSGSLLKLIRTSQVKGATETNGPYLRQTSVNDDNGRWKFDGFVTTMMYRLSESSEYGYQDHIRGQKVYQTQFEQSLMTNEISRLQELLEEPEQSNNCFIL